MPDPSAETYTTNPVGMGQCTETVLPEISAHMLIGYVRVSTDGDRQVPDLPHRRLSCPCLIPIRDGQPGFDDRAMSCPGQPACHIPYVPMRGQVLLPARSRQGQRAHGRRWRSGRTGTLSAEAVRRRPHRLPAAPPMPAPHFTTNAPTGSAIVQRTPSGPNSSRVSALSW